MNSPQLLQLQAYANSKNQRLGQFLNNAIGHHLEKDRTAIPVGGGKGNAITDFDVGTELFYVSDVDLLRYAVEYIQEVPS